MTTIRSLTQPSVHEGEVGVHSLDQFVLAVPDLKLAERFYSDFGLEVRNARHGLELFSVGGDHCWGRMVEGPSKRLHHLSFGCYSEDLPYFQERMEENGVEILDAPLGLESNGLWCRDPAGLLIEVKVAPKVSPDHKMSGTWSSTPEGVMGACARVKAPVVRPRRLSHLLAFTTNVDEATTFYSRVLGLRLSDSTGLAAFMHSIHGSDHHILAFAQAEAPGMHHCSWDVTGIDEIGLGAMHMASKGHTKGWGLGRHVLGSNYFHYVRDPWGSFAEYSADIDYIPATQLWEAGTYDDEDSFYLWGPEPPADFTTNYEARG
jgi:catechol 2,3-dioxygenase-like lactoylglutathione lyase family enzyme